MTVVFGISQSGLVVHLKSPSEIRYPRDSWQEVIVCTGPRGGPIEKWKFKPKPRQWRKRWETLLRFHLERVLKGDGK